MDVTSLLYGLVDSIYVSSAIVESILRLFEGGGGCPYLAGQNNYMAGRPPSPTIPNHEENSWVPIK